MNSNKVVLGLLSGFAAGALIGILFAPDKGSKIRKKIGRNTEDFSDSVIEKFEDLYEEITDTYVTLLEKAEDVVAFKQKK